ncbi:MAG: hypothetical protein WAM95_18335 [Bacillus sp. (in: firmicutes)]
MSRYVKSQSGAALLLVLFAVLFLSITGSVLLNTTTYSLKTNEKNEKIQGEFYSIEGAIDLVLDDMNSYKGNYVQIKLKDKNGDPITVQEVGPYFYLKDKLKEKTSLELTKMIGGRNVDITITNSNKKEYKEKCLKKDEGIEICATIIAHGTNVSRLLELKVQKDEEPSLKGSSTNTLNKIIYYNGNFNFNGSQSHDELDVKGNSEKSNEVYVTTLKNIGYQGITYDNNWTIDYSHNFSTGPYNPNKIDYKNKHTTLTIPKGKTVFVKNVDLNGGEIIIDGILVVVDFNMNGNPNVIVNGALIVTSNLNINGGGNGYAMVINSGIIANNMSTNGKNNFGGEGKGIDCSLLGLTGAYCSATSSSDPDSFIPEENPWTSSIVDIEYNTTRE